MSNLTLTKINLRNGRWEGRLTDADANGVCPDIRVIYLDQPFDSVDLQEGDGAGVWNLTVSVPMKAVTDGVQTFVIFDGTDDTKLGDFTLIAGEATADDMRAEMELLRAELDMLKRAFRRHCLETM